MSPSALATRMPAVAWEVAARASGDGEVSSDDEEAEEAERMEFTARKRDAKEKGGRESDDSDEE